MVAGPARRPPASTAIQWQLPLSGAATGTTRLAGIVGGPVVQVPPVWTDLVQANGVDAGVRPSRTRRRGRRTAAGSGGRLPHPAGTALRHGRETGAPRLFRAPAGDLGTAGPKGFGRQLSRREIPRAAVRTAGPSASTRRCECVTMPRAPCNLPEPSWMGAATDTAPRVISSYE